MDFLNNKSTLIRIGISAGLAVLALVLFLLSKPRSQSKRADPERDISATLAAIDHGVDSVLTQFHIESDWVRKWKVDIKGTDHDRIQRRVFVPPDLQSVTLNHALNAMAQRYHGRAVASENLRESTVTIHIEVLGNIVQTIILKTDPKLKKQTQNENSQT